MSNTGHEEMYMPEEVGELLNQPVEMVIGKSFVDSSFRVDGKTVPCSFLQVTVDVPDHTKWRAASAHSLPKIEVEIYGKRNGKETQTLTGYLMSEEDHELYLEWKHKKVMEDIEEGREESPAEILEDKDG